MAPHKPQASDGSNRNLPDVQKPEKKPTMALEVFGYAEIWLRLLVASIPRYPWTAPTYCQLRKQHLARDDGTVASQLLRIVITKLIVVLTSNQGPLYYYKYNKEPQNSIGNYLETDRLRFKLNDVNEPWIRYRPLDSVTNTPRVTIRDL